MNGDEKIVFFHGSCHSRGAGISTDRSGKRKINFVFSDTSGRTALTTLNISALIISLCALYAPYNCVDQL